ncbi:MAG TPA: hypothetical protein VEC37_02235, partial [Bacillota bacterium]|nr:hypothetical protein [Bacillota bacterium]
MSFGNSSIFPFPAVQYIPLALSVIQCGQLDGLTPKTQLPQLIIGAEVEKWRPVLNQDYKLNLQSG